ncbi:hypothetical protein RB653_007346 [Dictyostelium firmibasis]|uniref:SIS domain-containing protein n=1 Tax=Dictyostelium firmibasis TaxID=79012 RepID=A0AAN7TWD5_9MYCE
MTSITERINELTKDLDKVNSAGILRLLRQCDSQIFSGYLDYQSLNDQSIQNEIRSLVDRVVDRLKEGYSINVVTTGAGTSGRLAFFISRSFNKILREKGLTNSIRFNYLIAGGDLCLTVGMEGAEDNIDQALKDIKSQINQTVEGKKELLVYIGVTCGFSAPYVASQLKYLLDLNNKSGNDEKHIISLMGFNPIELARKIKIEKWDYSFNDIVIQLNQKRESQVSCGEKLDYFILNPIFGPEPLTGSTRMKSGTGTKILLELIFSLVLNKWKPIEFPLKLVSNNHDSNDVVDEDDVDGKLKLILKSYEITLRETYYNIEPISKIIDNVGNSLKSKVGHLYYLAPQSLGIVGFIDASETLPTFGARPLDVCGFLMNDKNNKIGGWEVMENRDGDLSSVSEQYNISQSNFLETTLPNSTSNDTIVISISSTQEFNQFKSEILPSLNENFKNQSIHLICFINDQEFTNKDDQSLKNLNLIKISLTNNEILNGLPCFYEISLKWILNSLTTGGFVLAGKVYGNRMIDLGLTNNKLFYRSCGIINSIMGLNSEETARQFLLRSVYSINTTSELPIEIKELPVYRHIEYCDESKVKSIVPVALLLASGKFTSPSLIREEIRKQPIIRILLDQYKPTTI